MTSNASLYPKLRALVRKAYSLPVLGWCVRFVVALVRLPRAEAYHAAVLKKHEERLRWSASELGEQADLIAETARLLEELRMHNATLNAKKGESAALADALDWWVAEFINELNLQRAALLRHQRLEHRREDFEEALSRLQAELNDTHQELWARAGALEAELERRGVELQRVADHLSKRIEFVRRETLFEVRYGESPQPGDTGRVEPRIVNPEKLNNIPEGGYRLNVGCGHIPLGSYINVDCRDLPSVDVIAEAGEMPFEEGSVGEIYSAHLLEHFPQEQLRREILPFWKSLLKPGGVLRAVVPDAESMIQGYNRGEVTYDDLREVTYGAQDYDGDFHFNMFTPASLSQLINEAGFVDISCPETGRRSGRCLEFEVIAIKPADGSRKDTEPERSGRTEVLDQGRS